ncbi:NUDIX hydrolase [Saccharopolyspora erythraea]|uniref:NUDIX hydrolase n=1 Tax=Saccharopolyspora erythraea TaxID=1836 RepID=UPI001BA61B32|nr:NUDIX hydrolase [Saccharopolyspora erythraea]QUH04861.1 NUDIX hydrolase [Saccharopolyspora erythraea]
MLGEWKPDDPQQEALRHAFLTLLDARADGCLRACEPGHVTASAVLLDSTGRNVLLTLHPRVGAWLQLGGHCEPEDATLAGAALREASEESGIEGLVVDPVPVHLDVHPITCSLGVPTRHFDVRFVVRAPEGAEAARSDESLDLRWWPVEALPDGSDLGPLVAAAERRVGSQAGARAPDA